MKKVTSLLLVLIFVLGIVPVIAQEAEVTTYENFVIEQSENGNDYIITGVVDDSVTEIIVPSKIEGTFKYLYLTEGAFADCKNLEKLTINNGNSIPQNLCNGLENLKEVYISSGTEIGDYAFKNTGIENINLASVSKIGTGAFEGCVNLKRVYFNSNHGKYIGDYAFSGCVNLRYVDLTYAKEIGEFAFYNCDSLTNVYMDSIVKWSGVLESQINPDLGLFDKNSGAPFVDCDSLSFVSINMKNTENTQDRPLMFLDCPNIKKVYATNIKHAFSKWEFATSETAGELDYLKKCENVIIISDNFNAGDLLAKELSVKHYGRGVAHSSRTALELDGVGPVIKPSFITNEPEAVKTIIFREGWTHIEDEAFMDLVNLEMIVLPSTMKEIGKKAFEGCANLKTIVFSEYGNIVLEDSAFAGCKGLETVEFKGLIEVRGKAFKNCTNLKNVIFPEEGFVDIFTDAFYGCIAIEELQLKNTDLSAGGVMTAPFGYVDNLKKVTIGKNVKAVFNSLGMWGGQVHNSFPGSVEHFKILEENDLYKSVDGVVFSKDTKTLLHYPAGKVCDVYTVPYGVETVGGGVGAGSCEVVKLPEGVKTLGMYAIAGVKELYLPKSIESFFYSTQDGANGKGTVGLYALNYGIENIYYAGSMDDWQEIAGVKEHERLLKDTQIHYNYEDAMVNIIGEEVEYKGLKYKFADGVYTLTGAVDKNVAEIYIPSNLDGVEVVINNGAFEECVNLKKVKLNQGVENIPFGAFANCTYLKEINLENVKYIGNEAFLNCYNLDNIKLETIESWGSNVFGGCIGLQTVEVNYPNFNQPLFANGENIKKVYMHSAPEYDEELKSTSAVIYGYKDEVKAFAEKNALVFEEGYEEVDFDDEFVYSDCIYKIKDGVLLLTKPCKKYIDEIFIPSELNGYKVVIKCGAFENNENLKRVYLSKKLTEIPDYAFWGCTSLEYVNLENIEKLGVRAFAECKSLKEVTLLNLNYWQGGRYYDIDLKKGLLPYWDTYTSLQPFIDSGLEKVTIKWPEKYVGNDNDADIESANGMMQTLFANMPLKEVYMLNAPKKPCEWEFATVHTVDGKKDVKRPDGMIIYGNSDSVKKYAESIGVQYVEKLNAPYQKTKA